MGVIATPILLSMMWGCNDRLKLDDDHLSHNQEPTPQRGDSSISDLGIIAMGAIGLFILLNLRFTSKVTKKANLNYADLKDHNLSKADLSGADLNYANLSGANLTSANLRYANLRGADLSGADLSETNFTYANLSGASLRYANLSRANLTSANLSGADLNCALLRGLILVMPTLVVLCYFFSIHEMFTILNPFNYLQNLPLFCVMLLCLLIPNHLT